MPSRELRRTLASFHLIIQKYTPLESSTSLRISKDTLYSPAGLGKTNTRVHHTHLKTSSRDSSSARTSPIALKTACLNYPLGYPGYRGDVGYPRYQMRLILILETMIFTDSSLHIWSS